MKSLFLAAAASLAILSLSAPAEARRTVIDSIEDPNNPGNSLSVVYTFSGYCDLNGEDCDAAAGFTLPYEVRLGTGAFASQVFVAGNGIVSFGAPLDLTKDTIATYCDEEFGCYPVSGGVISDRIKYEPQPALADYERNLVSLGQNNDVDFGDSFLQSAALSISNSGVISADFFVCYIPQNCVRSGNLLRLTPTSGGFNGEIIMGFGRNASPSNLGDQGFVIDGVTTNITGNTFFLPAEIRSLVAPGVPEPSSWAMLIVGFGVIGGAMRSRRSGHLRTQVRFA